jgi:hypothetical protein
VSFSSYVPFTALKGKLTSVPPAVAARPRFLSFPFSCTGILILLGLGIGWIIRYSRKAAKFRRFWNQTVPVPRREDYELKQHRDPLIYQRDADGASVRTRPTSVMSRNDTREGEDLGGRSCTSGLFSSFYVCCVCSAFQSPIELIFSRASAYHQIPTPPTPKAASAPSDPPSTQTETKILHSFPTIPLPLTARPPTRLTTILTLPLSRRNPGRISLHPLLLTSTCMFLSGEGMAATRAGDSWITRMRGILGCRRWRL